MKKTYELDSNLSRAILKIQSWLQTKESSDLTGTVSKSLETLSFILIREYYTDSERELLNELRSQYVREMGGKKN